MTEHDKKIIKERLKLRPDKDLIFMINDPSGKSLLPLIKGCTELIGLTNKEIYLEVLESLQLELEARADEVIIDDDPEFTPTALPPFLKRFDILHGKDTAEEVEPEPEPEPKKQWSFWENTAIALAGVLAVVVLISTVFGVSLKEEKSYSAFVEDSLTVEHARYMMASAERDAIQKEYDKLDLTLSEVQDKLALMLTFQQSGFKTDSAEEVRDLLELAEDIPYGSPFLDGHIITDEYGIRDERWFAGDGNHTGIDIIPAGWEEPPIIRTTANGSVIDFGYNDIKGKYVLFENESGTFRILYGHLSKIYWQKDTEVRNIPLTKGTKLGIMGDTGLTNGAHLHMELYVKSGSDWVLLNPKEIINYVGN